MLVSVWVFVFMLVYKGATRPLDFVLLDYNGAITPRPFLCVHKEKGQEMHSLNCREGLRRASNIVFNPASQDFITRAAVRGEKLM